MTTSTLFSGGYILDGLGDTPYLGDVRVAGDTITDVTTGPSKLDADTVIELGGAAIAPGFIDMHTHSDLQILANPDHAPRITQGITTEVLGQDGLSYAPVTDETLAELRGQIKGWNDDPEGFDWNWRSVAEYLARLDGNVATNCAYLAPHGTIRMMVMGNEARLATPAELEAMKDVLRQALDEGCCGLSTGLTYAPMLYSDTDELVELCKVVAEYGGYFTPHHRNYGSDALGGYGECLEIAKRSGVALHLAHCHLSFEPNRGKLPQLLAAFDAAEADGVDLSFDSYPYLAGMTTLLSQLPGWALAGSGEEQMARLHDPETRARIIEALNVTGSDGHQGLTVNWDQLHITSVPGAPEFEWIMEGSLAAAAEKLGREPADFALDLLIATDRAASAVMFMGIEAHVRRLMQHHGHTVGSDGIMVGDRPHPRSWGTFPTVLETYVRKDGILSLPDAIAHMTSRAAKRLKLDDRGVIAPGKKADLVVFSPQDIAARATYADPKQPSAGISHVMVNGTFALQDGSPNGRRAGRVVGQLVKPS